MASYQTFTVARTTQPDPATLLTQLRALDATAGVQHTPGTAIYVVKKNTPWLPAHVTAAQTVLENAPVASAQLAAQSTIDSWPLDLKAAFLVMMDEINKLRALQTPVPAAYTATQFLAAIRAKAATL